jgi:hypothetical protein
VATCKGEDPDHPTSCDAAYPPSPVCNQTVFLRYNSNCGSQSAFYSRPQQTMLVQCANYKLDICGPDDGTGFYFHVNSGVLSQNGCPVPPTSRPTPTGSTSSGLEIITSTTFRASSTVSTSSSGGYVATGLTVATSTAQGQSTSVLSSLSTKITTSTGTSSSQVQSSISSPKSSSTYTGNLSSPRQSTSTGDNYPGKSSSTTIITSISVSPSTATISTTDSTISKPVGSTTISSATLISSSTGSVYSTPSSYHNDVSTSSTMSYSRSNISPSPPTSRGDSNIASNSYFLTRSTNALEQSSSHATSSHASSVSLLSSSQISSSSSTHCSTSSSQKPIIPVTSASSGTPSQGAPAYPTLLPSQSTSAPALVSSVSTQKTVSSGGAVSTSSSVLTFSEPASSYPQRSSTSNFEQSSTLPAQPGTSTTTSCPTNVQSSVTSSAGVTAPVQPSVTKTSASQSSPELSPQATYNPSPIDYPRFHLRVNSPPRYLTTTGHITADIHLAVLFHILNGRLYTENGAFVSVNDIELYKPIVLAQMTSGHSISTVFSLVSKPPTRNSVGEQVLQWQNPAFAEDKIAKFCTEDETVYAVVGGEPIPKSCAPAELQVVPGT